MQHMMYAVFHSPFGRVALAPFRFLVAMVMGFATLLGFGLVIASGLAALGVVAAGIVVMFTSSWPAGMILFALGLMVGGAWLSLMEWLGEVVNR